jgi:hypothetical protein
MTKEKGFRTLLLCILGIVGGWTLAYLTKQSELVYAFAVASTGPLTLWVSGKGMAGYTDMLTKTRGEKNGEAAK